MQPTVKGFSVVYAGTDSLDVRVFRHQFPSDLCWEVTRYIRDYFDMWQPGENPCVVDVPDLGVFEVVSDRRPYEFVLIDRQVASIRFWNPDKWETSRDTGQFYISFRSRFLLEQGPAGAWAYIQRVIETFCGDRWLEVPEGRPEFVRVSAIDLCADIAGRRVTLDDVQAGFVCRTRKNTLNWSDINPALQDFSDSSHVISCTPQTKNGSENRKSRNGKTTTTPLDNRGCDNYREGVGSGGGARLLPTGSPDPADCVGTVESAVLHGRTLATVYFGRFASNLFCRIYDKLLSLAPQGKTYMREVWTANGWDGLDPVWRVEFHVTGKFLREIRTSNAVEFWECMKAVEGIWAYLTQSWLRHTIPDQKNQSRWKTSLWWETVQGAYADLAAVSRVTDRHAAGDISRSVTMGGAYMVSAVASAVDDPTDAQQVASAVFEFCNLMMSIADQPDFVERVATKRYSVGKNVAPVLQKSLAARPRAARPVGPAEDAITASYRQFFEDDAMESYLMRKLALAQGGGS